MEEVECVVEHKEMYDMRLKNRVEISDFSE